MKWQPIETAPKDGTLVDLWVEWSEMPGTPAHGERLPDCRWEDRDADLTGLTGWMQKYQETGDSFFWLGDGWDSPKPTHWMLPPTPPLSANSHADVGQGLRPDRS